MYMYENNQKVNTIYHRYIVVNLILYNLFNCFQHFTKAHLYTCSEKQKKIKVQSRKLKLKKHEIFGTTMLHIFAKLVIKARIKY